MKTSAKLKPLKVTISGRARALLRQSYLFEAGYTDKQIVMSLISAPLWYDRRDKAKKSRKEEK